MMTSDFSEYRNLLLQSFALRDKDDIEGEDEILEILDDIWRRMSPEDRALTRRFDFKASKLIAKGDEFKAATMICAKMTPFTIQSISQSRSADLRLPIRPEPEPWPLPRVAWDSCCVC